MGSEQSSQKGQSKRKGKNPKRSHSAGSDKDGIFRRPSHGGSSPRPSICSDSDIPYVSYTKTRPISDDNSDTKLKWSSDVKAKPRGKATNREKRDNKAKSVGSIVTVKPAAEILTVDKDPLYKKLSEIPPFSPIIRDKPGVSWTKNPEITEKIEPLPFLKIALMCSRRLRHHEESTKLRQLEICKAVNEADAQIYHITKILSSREKIYTDFVEEFSRINDMSNMLSACHLTLNKTIESVEALNNMLAPDNRLEPFVWTTG